MQFHQKTPWKLEESARQIIHDSFNQKRAEIDFSDSRYLLKIGESKKGFLYFFDPEFTRCTHDIELEYLRNKDCIIFAAKEAIYRIIVLGKKAIQLYRCKISQQGAIKSDFEKFTFPFSILKNEELVYLSPSIELGDKEYHLVYSDQDVFYLLALTIDKKYSIDLIKLKDLDENKGLFTWFKKSDKPHYQTIRMTLIKGNNQNQIRAVSIRDQSMTIHQIDLKNTISQSTIKTIKTLNSFSKYAKGQLSDALFMINSEIHDRISITLYVIYTLQKNVFSMIKVKLDFCDKKLLLEIDQTVPLRAKYFILKYFRGTFFLNFCQEKQNKVYQIAEDDLMKINENLTFQINPLVHQQDKVILCSKGDTLLAISDMKIVSISFDSIYQFNISQDCEKEFKTQIHKHLQLNQFKQISDIFEQELQQLSKNEQEDINTPSKILCLFLLKTILRSNGTIRILKDEDESEMLQQCCQNVTAGNVAQLLRIITKIKLYKVFIDQLLHPLVLEFLRSKENQDNKIWKENIRQLTHKAINIIIQDLRAQKSLSNVQKQYFKNLVTCMSEFSSDAEVTPQMLSLLLPDEQKQVKNIITTKNFSSSFIYFFSKGLLTFDHHELHEIAKTVFEQDRQNFTQFIRKLLIKCYRQWKKQLNEDNKIEKCKVLVQGLKDFQNQVVPHLKSTFPGLAYFFYLKENVRKFKSKEISDLASKTKCPQTSYFMNLSVLDCNKEYSYPLLTTSKLCLELKEKNLSPETLLQILKQKKDKEIVVSQKTWRQWKMQMNAEHLKDIQEIEKKISFVT